ncbi:hypothetical protein CHARACLAT_011998, partial [Characodon lateralis]|nr:hypothetical protein [Characodon lateralis]
NRREWSQFSSSSSAADAQEFSSARSESQTAERSWFQEALGFRLEGVAIPHFCCQLPEDNREEGKERRRVKRKTTARRNGGCRLGSLQATSGRETISAPGPDGSFSLLQREAGPRRSGQNLRNSAPEPDMICSL